MSEEGLRRALIVATSSYRDERLRRLRAPGKDARALSLVLADKTIGFFDDVDVVLDRRVSTLLRTIERFFQSGSLNDLLLLHFSCHGIKNDEGDLYFAATDTDLDYLDSSAISAEFVNRQMGRSRSRRKILLLDCCYSGAFAPGLGARAGEGVDLKERFDGHGQVVLTASSSMEYAFEGTALRGSGKPSVFTSAVVQGLKTGDADRDGDGQVSVSELFDYVSDELRRFTSKQTPSMWNYDLRGEIVIAHRALQPAGARIDRPTAPPLVGPSVNLARWVHTDPSEESQPVGVLAMEASLAYHGKWIRLDRADFWRKLRARANKTVPIKPKDTTIAYLQIDLIATLTEDGVTSSEGKLFRARATRLRTAQEILSAINRGSPVITGLSVPEIMLSKEVSTFGQLPSNWSSNPMLGGTTVGIFGYDSDNRRWLLLTGWPSWGVGGFGWIAAETLSIGAHSDSFGIEVPNFGDPPDTEATRPAGGDRSVDRERGGQP